MYLIATTSSITKHPKSAVELPKLPSKQPELPKKEPAGNVLSHNGDVEID